MTLSQLRSLVRRRVDDEQSSRWSDADVVNELNNAARFVHGKIQRAQRINFSPSTEAETTTSSAKTYALAASDIRRLWKIERTDSTVPEPVRIIDERDQYTATQNGLKDDTGHWIVFMTYAAGVWSFNFFSQPSAGMTFTVTYSTTIADLTTGVAPNDDANTYDEIEAQYHELLAVRASMLLIGHDHSRTGFVTGLYGELMAAMVSELEAAYPPGGILQEMDY